MQQESVVTWDKIAIYPVWPENDQNGQKISNVREIQGKTMEKQQKIVEREEKRLQVLGRRHGVFAANVATHRRGDTVIIYASHAGGESLITNNVDENAPEGHVNLEFALPQLVTMVKEDGTVVRGASEEVRETLAQWYADMAAYRAALDRVGRRLEERMKEKQYGNG